MPIINKRDIKFQNQKESIEEEFNFAGGLVVDQHETKLESAQTPNVENIVYTSTGTIKTRNGYTRYNGDPVGATSDEANILDILSDDFSGASVDTVAWAETATGSATVTQTGGQLEIALPSSATSSDLGQLKSVGTFDMTSGSVVVDIAQAVSASTNANQSLQLYIDSNNWLQWTIENGTLYAQYLEGGSKTTAFSVAFNGTTHKWWRIREASGDVYWDTSEDGSAWTNRASYTTGLTITAMYGLITAYCYQNETDPGTGIFDNFSLTTVSNDSSIGTITLDSYQDYVAQTFTVDSDADMVQVDFYLQMNTSGETQLIRAELWSGDTGPDAKLYSAQILQVTGTSEAEYSFRFRTPYTLTASTEYAVVLKPFTTGSSTSINTVLVNYTVNNYANGGAYTSTNSGIDWSAVSNTDLKFNIYTGGSTGGTGLIRYYGPNDISQTLAKFGSTMYRGNDSTGAMTTITTASGVDFAAAGYLDWIIINDTLITCDGTNYMKKYRGSTNSNYSTGTITVTEDSTLVTGSGTSWSTTTNAEADEYIQLPDGKWYLITQVGSDTNITIETAYLGSSSAGESYVISPWGELQGSLVSNSTPATLTRPKPKYVANHLNRFWTLSGNTLNFSVLDTSITGEHINDFDSANNAGSIIIPSSKGDTGTGLYSLGGKLYIFQNRSIWGLYGTSPASYELRNITNEIGLIDKGSLVEWNDLIVFLSNKGIQYFDGTNLRNVSDGIVNKLIDTWNDKTNCKATLWNNTYLLSYTNAGESNNSEILFLDLTRQAFGKMTNCYVGGWSNWDGGSDTGQVYFIGSNQGTIYKWDTGGHDDGYELYSLYDTPSLTFGNGINDKAIKKFYLQQLQLGDWDMQVTQFSDIDASNITGADINLSSGTSALWDTAVWDTDTWPSEGSIATTRVAEFQGLAKYFKFRFEQTGYNEGLEVLGMLAASRVRRLR